MQRAILFALIVLALSLAAARVRAEPALVVLVRPAPASAVANEAITRIRGELVADGFDVLVVNAAPGADAAAVLVRAGADARAAATLGLFLQSDAQRAEVWIVDRLTNKTVMRAVEIRASSASAAPEVLARRSVELLRASLLEMLVDTREEPVSSSEPRAGASSWAAQRLATPQSRWSVEAGAQVLGNFGELGAALMPLGRVRFALHRRISARATLAGLGTRPRVKSAAISQALGLFELVGDVSQRGWLRPFVSLGAGAYHVGVEGSANHPYLGLEDERFVFAADAGAGVALAMTPTWALSIEAHTLLVTPYPVIRFLETSSVEIPNPLVSAALTLVGRL